MLSSLLVLVLTAVSSADGSKMSRIKSDEYVIFFPTAARLSDDGRTWIIPIHGWIFEPEENDFVRRLLIGQLQRWLPQETTEQERQIFNSRLRWFLVDNERNKRIGIKIGAEETVLSASAVDGHFSGVVEAPVTEANPLARDGKLIFRAVTHDARSFEGTAYLYFPHGVSVISDIDDTIKVSEVCDRARLLKNTLMRPFVAVEGMAQVYDSWAARGAQFHFVSMSPWQLYQPLADFTSASGFPAAVFHLQRFRVKDSSFWNLFADPQLAKSVIIEEIIAQYPLRQFILVGDSTQKDPELYGQIARTYPDRVQHIYIRRVPQVPSDASRFDASFAGIPVEKWSLFDSAAELPRTLPH